MTSGNGLTKGVFLEPVIEKEQINNFKELAH